MKRGLLAIVVLSTLSIFAADEFSWQQRQAAVSPTGELKWSPRPFTFKAGASVKYIDYEGGDDKYAGTKASPWKHHPWDKAAGGKAKACKGIHTYVFKRGVTYRGELRAPESGKAGDPIRLTSDPSWGEGSAFFYGSKQIKGGWKKATGDTGRVPKNPNLWYIDLGKDFDSDGKEPMSALFVVKGDEIIRLHIARDPNYSDANPLYPWRYWHKWDKISGIFNRATVMDGWLKGKDKNFLDGARIWTQHPHIMGTVHSVSPKNFDPKDGKLDINSPGGATWGMPPRKFKKPRRPTHYFVECVPDLLDAPGEYFYDSGRKAKQPDRLYLIPPAGVDPNAVVFEAPQVRCPIQIFDKSHIEVSGLHFRFNDPDDGTYGYPHQIGLSPCVRIVGNCQGITVHHCRFEHVANAVVAFPRYTNEGGPYNAAKKDVGEFQNDYMDDIEVLDCDIQHAEKMGAIYMIGASQKGGPDKAFGRLGDVRIMRCRVFDTGFRPSPWPTSSIPAIYVSQARTVEIAGNIIKHSWGNGIFTLGGRGSGSFNEVPFIRYLVYQNQIDDTMLGCNDYGGLEHFQGGPYYVFNNITRGTIGTTTFTKSELGYNLYLDGGFKCYSFNNIIAGSNRPDQPDYYSHCGYFMVFGFLDHLFNNTIYRFEYALNGSSGNRSNILGNLMLDCKKTFIGQNRPGDVSMMGGGDTGEAGRTGIPTMAYGSNVFYGKPHGLGKKGAKDAFGFVGGNKTGDGGKAAVYGGNTLEELSKELAELGCRVSSIGWHVDKMPLRDPAKKDYRPAPGSPAKDRGVRFFVPWSLSKTVGEWNFYKSESHPELVLGEHFYMQEEYYERSIYYYVPRNDLTFAKATPEIYTNGELEDWIPGAVVFDGKRKAVLTHADMVKDVDYPIAFQKKKGKIKILSKKKNKGGELVHYDGAKRKTLDMSNNNFLIEVYLKAKGSGSIAAKMQGQIGYALRLNNGALVLDLKTGGGGQTINGPAIGDGNWHHVLVEVDRKGSKLAFYVDGKGKTHELKLQADASLANKGDFIVGAGLTGAIDFLRVARSTLAESQTDIDELYAWQFNGPQLHDFSGRKPKGKRDAGALEMQ